MKVVAIAAVADNGVIGSGQEMLWHISEAVSYTHLRAHET